MANLADMNYSTGCATFSVDSAEEISKLPTTTAKGTDELSGEGPVKAGSWAYRTDSSSDIYTLNGISNTWIKKV